MTCGHHPGSYEHEFIDARSFAEWGVDFLKYDYCFKPADDKGHLLYRRMGTALANCGRDILFSACSWGADDTKSWIKTTGAHMWRSTVDIFDTWESIKSIAQQQRDIQPYNGQGCFNDMDMLVVGMGGNGHVGLQGCDFVQYRTHFSLWAFFGSPLMIGCDIRNMGEETRSILLNKDVLAINQDPSYRQPFLLGGCQTFASGGTDDCFIWAKLLYNGEFAIGLFNLSDDISNMYFCMAELGLNRSCSKKLIMTNLWSGEVTEACDYHYSAAVPAHDCVLLRAKVVDE
jgi:alpha-galactosidase